MTAFLWLSFAFSGLHTILDMVIMSQEGVSTGGLVATALNGGMLGGATYLLVVN